jgi:hypothetical protein
MAIARTNQLRAAIFLAKLFAADVAGVVAQLVERLVRNEKVAGSNPVGSTSLHQIFRKKKQAVSKSLRVSPNATAPL